MAVGHGLDAGQAEGQGLHRDIQARKAGHRPQQAKGALAADRSTRADARREFLQHNLLEIKQGQRLHRFHPLAKALQFGPTHPHESVGNGVLEAPPHQQLKIRLAGGPGDARFGQAREEAQPVIPAGHP